MEPAGGLGVRRAARRDLFGAFMQKASTFDAGPGGILRDDLGPPAGALHVAQHFAVADVDRAEALHVRGWARRTSGQSSCKRSRRPMPDGLARF